MVPARMLGAMVRALRMRRRATMVARPAMWLGLRQGAAPESEGCSHSQ